MNKVLKALTSYANAQKAKDLSRFFKTGVGEYGEGDKFLGIVVPIQRKIVKEYWNKITLNDVEELLHNSFHECRLTALIILVAKYKKGSGEEKKKIAKIYLQNTKYINNWDLVDLTAPKIVGPFFSHKSKSILIKLAYSQNLWERRIALLATFDYIRLRHFKTALRISNIVLKDKEDLIHKAVGWMLREIGKRNQKVEEEFLKKYYKIMPRTMLRYAIEKFDEKKKKYYMMR